MFGAFGDVKRRQPVFTFKRGAVFSAFSDHNKQTSQQQKKQPFTVQTSSTSKQLHISPSTSNSTLDSEDALGLPENAESNNSKPGLEKQDKKQQDIFDFPESLDDFSEVKLMVASTRLVPEMPKLTRTRSKPKGKTKSSPSNSTSTSKKPSSSKSDSTANTSKKRSLNKNTDKPPCTVNTTTRLPSNTTSQLPSNSQPFDIFAFDPSPTCHLSYNKPIANTNTTTQSSYSANYYNNTTTQSSYSSNYYNHATTQSSYSTNCYNNTNVQQSRYHPVSIASLLNNDDQPVFRTKLVEKKRKRNLVAHLKGASGEKESKPLLNRRFDFLSDEDEMLEQGELLPLREIITNKERSLSPELNYNQRMQLELDSLMESEFGIEKTQDKTTDESHRKLYQPLNKVNVRVTFKKK